MHAPELYCLTFGAEPASGLGADQPWMAHGANGVGSQGHLLLSKSGSKNQSSDPNVDF